MPLITLQLPNSILKALRLPQNNPRSQQLRVLKIIEKGEIYGVRTTIPLR